MQIYTDGSCNFSPEYQYKKGPGGWAFLLIEKDRIWEVNGGDTLTTNNRMELEAIINGINFCRDGDRYIEIITDSKYVMKGFTLWIQNWIKKNWKDVKNVDLWKQLLEVSREKNIKWTWVKSHSNNKFNDRVDFLAKIFAKKLNKKIKYPS